MASSRLQQLLSEERNLKDALTQNLENVTEAKNTAAQVLSSQCSCSARALLAWTHGCQDMLTPVCLPVCLSAAM